MSLLDLEAASSTADNPSEHGIVGGSSPSDRGTAVVDAIADRDRIEAELRLAVAEWAATRAWEADGALSASQWLAWRTGVSRRTAGRLLAGGRFMNRFDATRVAVAGGSVSPDQLDTLTRHVTDERFDLYARDEHVLLEAAGRFRADEFTTIVRRWASHCDDALSAADAEHAHQTRSFWLTRTLFGRTEGSFSLDADAGAMVIAAIDDITTPDPVEAPDRRTPTQLRADALTDLARHYLNRTGHETGAGRSPIPTHALVDLDTLEPAPPTPETPTPGGGGAITLDDLLRKRCEITNVGPIPADTARRLTCSGTIARLVLGADSVVLDHGRNRYKFTSSQRAAITARDGGCIVPWCRRPAHWCDTHHIEWWEAGGTTSVANGALLCRRHHRLFHEGRWTLTRTGRGPDKIIAHDGRTWPVARARTHPPPDTS